MKRKQINQKEIQRRKQQSDISKGVTYLSTGDDDTPVKCEETSKKSYKIS